MTPRGVLAVGAGIGLMLALILWGALREPDNDRRARAATTYSSGESGAKALYLLLEQSGVTVTRLRRLEYEGVDLDRVLWILSPAALPTGDAEPLLGFVKRGGTVVAPARLAADLLVRSGVATAKVDSGTCDKPPCRLENPWKLSLTAEPESLQRIAGVTPAESYASVGSQAIVARYEIAGGNVVSVGLLDSLRNRGIGAGDAGPFWIRLAGELGETHAFDEVHTGYGDLNLLTLIWRAPYRWAALDLAFVIAVGVWGFGGRERRACRDPALRRRETKDHVQAVADWWARSGDLGLPLTALLVGLDARAAGRIHAPGGRNFIAWASAMRPELGTRAAEAWRHAEQLLAKKPSSPREVVTVASALRALEKEVFPC